MLDLIFVSVFWAALISLYIGVVKRKAEATVFLFSAVMWAVVSAASFNVEVPLEYSVTVVEVPGLSALGMGLALLSFAFALLAVLDWLPEPSRMREGMRNG